MYLKGVYITSKINRYDLLQNVEVLYQVILLPNRN